jgi:hypothetical protein
MEHVFRVIRGCPVPEDIAPYIWLATEGCTVDSIYRGDDARALLNKYGKHSQKQLYNATPAERSAWGVEGQPNAPGHSSHEQYSDGVAYPHIPSGHPLAWWQIGFDVADADVPRVISQAARYGWHVFRPYRSGVEFHHLNFASQPLPGSHAGAITKLRASLPRS